MASRTRKGWVCDFDKIDERTGAIRLKHPAVECQGRCGKCAWNPDEQKRRIEHGEWVYDGKLLSLRFKK